MKSSNGLLMEIIWIVLNIDDKSEFVWIIKGDNRIDDMINWFKRKSSIPW